MRNANTYTPSTCVQPSHIWNCSWRPHVCNNIFAAHFFGPASMRECASVSVCAEFVIFFCNIFFCVPFDVLAGGRERDGKREKERAGAASVVGCAFG